MKIESIRNAFFIQTHPTHSRLHTFVQYMISFVTTTEVKWCLYQDRQKHILPKMSTMTWLHLGALLKAQCGRFQDNILQPFWFGMSLGARIGVLLAVFRTCMIVSDHIFGGKIPRVAPACMGWIEMIHWVVWYMCQLVTKVSISNDILLYSVIFTLAKGEGIAFGSVCLSVCLSAQNFCVFLHKCLLDWDKFFAIGASTHVECFNDNYVVIGHVVLQPYWKIGKTLDRCISETAPRKKLKLDT